MITLLSKTKDGLVTLDVNSKIYYYQFESQDHWNKFYFANSYPKSKSDIYTRTIRMSILNKIKGFRILEQDLNLPQSNNNSEQSNMEIVY